MGDADSPVPGPPASPPWLDDVLEAIEQFGVASIGLVAWEFFVTEEELVPAWRDATILGLVERVGRCPYTREPMYRLTRPLDQIARPIRGKAFTAAFLDTTPINAVTSLTATNSPDREPAETPQPI